MWTVETSSRFDVNNKETTRVKGNYTNKAEAITNAKIAFMNLGNLAGIFDKDGMLVEDKVAASGYAVTYYEHIGNEGGNVAFAVGSTGGYELARIKRLMSNHGKDEPMQIDGCEDEIEDDDEEDEYEYDDDYDYDVLSMMTDGY